MPIITHLLECRNSAGFVAGITPVVSVVKKSDLTVINPAPVTIREVLPGLYEFVFDIAEAVYAAVDFGATLTEPDDRYRTIAATPDDESVTIVRAPAGSRTITIVTEDTEFAPIPGVRVEIRNLAGQAIDWCDTDANGAAIVNLNDAQYVFVATKPMCSFEPYAVTIDANSTVTLDGLVASPALPSVGCQTLWVIPDTPSLLLDTACVITAEAVITNQFVDTAILTSTKLVATRTATHFTLVLAKGGKFIISGKVNNVEFLRKTITVTNDDIRELKAYI